MNIHIHVEIVLSKEQLDILRACLPDISENITPAPRQEQHSNNGDGGEPIPHLRLLDEPIDPKDFTTNDPITVPGIRHLIWGETSDGRLYIRYLTGKIYTTWDEINRINELNPYLKTFGKFLLNGVGAKKTALNRFIHGVRTGIIKPHSSLNDPTTAEKPADTTDPDEIYRPLGLGNAAYPPRNCTGDFGKGGGD